MPAEMLLDLSGNKYNPNAMDDWQDLAVELYQGGKALMPYAQEAVGQLQTLYRDFTRSSNRYFTPPSQSMLVAPGHGGEPIKGPAGNSTVSDLSGTMAYGGKRARSPYSKLTNTRRKSLGISKGMAAAVRKIAKKAVVTVSEKNYVSYIQAAVQPTTTGFVVSLTDTAQGDGDAGFRTGDQIRLHDLELRGQVIAVTSPDVLRIIVFYWKSSFTLDPPTMANVLQAAPYVNSAKNVDQDRAHLATILYDRTFTTSIVDSDLEAFAIKIPLNGHAVSYVGGSTTNQLHGLYIGMVNRSGLANVQWSALTRYTDP